MTQNTFSLSIGDTIITLTTNLLAPQANASVLAQSGHTLVLATVVMADIDPTKDYFPLTVEFVDKLYAGGVIKGGKWVKRELNPSDNSILFGRIIDRAIRPLFPSDFHHQVQLVATVLSNDKEHDVIVPAFLAAAAALSISDLPFDAPVSCVRLGRVNQKLIINPTLSQLKNSDLDLLACTDSQGINMIEASAKIVDHASLLSALKLAYSTGQQINRELQKITSKIGLPKTDYQPYSPDSHLIAAVEKLISADLKTFFTQGTDGGHTSGQRQIIDKVIATYQPQIDEGGVDSNYLKLAVDIIISREFRRRTLKGQRYDHRQLAEIRPLSSQVGLLPCTHGSALFQRGLTQVLTITTLASVTSQQYLEDSLGETTKRYLHYYSAAPFSLGEVGRFGRPGRREIGHGALAEKALLPVIPSVAEFPYTICLTSEILSQNGSSSMAATCGSTLSLMDAGVPIKSMVAGISIGMVSDKQKFVLLTDIAGPEDHFGDMDFKITGTKDGITAIQLDVKRPGLTLKMITDVFTASTKARLTILSQMAKTLSRPRPQLAPLAPKVVALSLPADKVGEVIGSGGKTIRALMDKYAVQIDIEDDGTAYISAQDQTKVEAAAAEITALTKEVAIGEEYDGTVTRVENYGAFVEFLPGREALLHVSELSGAYLDNPAAIIKVGDKIRVRISGFNDNHQIKLSAPAFKAAHPAPPGSNQVRFRR
jgi:polyribonucleotide nucleotidyltransferase